MIFVRSNAESCFLQTSLNSSAGDHTLWTFPRMRSEGFLFMSAGPGLGVELCLPTVGVFTGRRLQVRRRRSPHEGGN